MFQRQVNLTYFYFVSDISVTDLSINLASINFSTPSVMRNTSMDVEFSIVLFNNGPAPVDYTRRMINEHEPNFKLRLWFSDSDSLTSKYNDTAWTSDFNLTLKAWENQTIDKNETFGFSADICFHLKYLCIQIEPTSSLVYNDTNMTNNYVCSLPTFSIICQPGKKFTFGSFVNIDKIHIQLLTVQCNRTIWKTLSHVKFYFCC